MTECAPAAARSIEKDAERMKATRKKIEKEKLEKEQKLKRERDEWNKDQENRIKQELNAFSDQLNKTIDSEKLKMESDLNLKKEQPGIQ